MPLSAEVQDTYRIRDLMDALLADPRQLGPDYQPIHSLSQARRIGYKATGRGAPGTELADTLSLLDGARSLGFLERIDWAFRSLAFEDILAVPAMELHLTPEPETFGTPCAPRFAGLMSRANRELRVAAEIHEDAFAPGVALARGLAEIREWGWKVVLADLADHETSLARAHEIAPDVVQIDLRLPRRTNCEEHHGVRRLLELAESNGAQVMVLGVDDSRGLEAAEAFGASTARGTLFGGPGPLAGH